MAAKLAASTSHGSSSDENHFAGFSEIGVYEPEPLKMWTSPMSLANRYSETRPSQ